MCGIFGFVADRDRDISIVMEKLRYLEYRGYDSWGVAVAQDGRVVAEKAVGSVSRESTHLPPSRLALGHTRWATHGGVSFANAHPHIDCDSRLALIHNGIVENHQELKARLRRNHQFRSQTDTEVLVHMMEEATEDGGDLLSALLAVFGEVQGLSAVAVMDAGSGEMAIAKNGSPLVLGWGDGTTYLASDATALLDYTQEVTYLEDGQAVGIRDGQARLVDLRTAESLEPDIRKLDNDTASRGLDGHAHFMSKEIHEQPRILRQIAERSRDDVQRLAEQIQEAEDVYLVGCGTAYHAALSGRYILSEVAGRKATAVMASEMDLIYPILNSHSLVIALSQSGETIDVLDAVKGARARGAGIAALVNAEGSALDRVADVSVRLGCGPEQCVLATKSYTAKLAVLVMTAYALAGSIEEGTRLLVEASHHVASALDRDAVQGNARGIARQIADQQHLFVLGRNRNYPLALEAALKIKEVSYMHAEGFASGELKHGVIALVTPGTPCIVLAPDAGFRREVLAAGSEVHARGAYTIGLSPRAEEEFDVTMQTCGGPLAAFEVSVNCQLLAYELALLRGCDPDKPRNLAKSVTVK